MYPAKIKISPAFDDAIIGVKTPTAFSTTLLTIGDPIRRLFTRLPIVAHKTTFFALFNLDTT